jgi:glycogen debranching enzyme
MDVPGLDQLLSAEGWPYASTPPVSADDPGRFHALTARQGRGDDPDTLEEPGKILHEHRPQPPRVFAEAGWPAGEFTYYASADSTSWFLVVLEATGDAALAAELEPSRRAAAEWLDRALARGGGLIRYGPGRRPGGLTQHGWRDAIDPVDQAAGGQGIVRPDGSVPGPPVADADTQAVAYAALRALHRLSGDARWARHARLLASRLEAHFGPEVLALEGDGRVVPGAGSHLGWLLWSGAVQGEARERIADRLCEDDVLTPFGLRTLSSRHPAFDAHAYHRGSVWPFDSWLGWAGLRAAGRGDAAERVRTGVLEGLERLGHAPELYAVPPGRAPEHVALANRVQAWTVGARWALGASWDGRRAVD